MIREFAIASLFGLAGMAGAQGVLVEVDTLRAQRPFGPKEEYTFPVIITPDRPEVGERIDQSLRVELLSRTCDSLPLACLEAVWGSMDSAGNFVTPELRSISWSVAKPFGSLLVVTFSAEGCGAYCEGFTTHRSYDLSLGALVTWDQLRRNDERVVMEDSILHLWRKQVSQEMQNQELEMGARSSEELERWNAAKGFYLTCMEDRAQRSLPVVSFEPLEQSVRVYVERCSDHADRSLDEMGSVAIDLPYDWLEPYLAPELRRLFIR